MIMKFLIISLIFIFSSGFAGENELKFEVVLVPTYSPPIHVLNADKEPLGQTATNKLEFRDLELCVPYERASGRLWKPQSVSEAASMLRVLVPEDFYQRLILGLDEFKVHGEILNDPAVSERIGDVAYFISEIWDLNTQFFLLDDKFKNDDFEFLFRILEYDSNTLE